jgi:hypothetical protein
MGVLGCLVHASPVGVVSLMISVSLGAVCAIESMRHSWKQLVDDFRVPMGSLCCRILVSPLEVVSLMISETTVTQFSLMISNSTVALCAVESMRYP